MRCFYTEVAGKLQCKNKGTSLQDQTHPQYIKNVLETSVKYFQKTWVRTEVYIGIKIRRLNLDTNSMAHYHFHIFG